MAVEIRVPQFGESVTEAVVGRWLKQEGDAVAPDEAVVELETDKVAVEVIAEQGGVLQHIAQAEGATVNVGDVLATLADGAGASGGNGAGAPVRLPRPRRPSPRARATTRTARPWRAATPPNTASTSRGSAGPDPAAASPRTMSPPTLIAAP